MEKIKYFRELEEVKIFVSQHKRSRQLVELVRTETRAGVEEVLGLVVLVARLEQLTRQRDIQALLSLVRS